LAETGQQSGGVVSFSDAVTGAVRMIGDAFEREGKLSGLSTGLIDVDAKLGGLHPSDLLIIAGRPSMGKTALATNIAFNVARAYRYEQQPDGTRRTVDGGQVLFFSLEMSEEQLAARILADVSGVSGDKLRKGEIDRSEYARVRDAAVEIAESPLHIDATGALRLSKLAARARRQKRRTGLDLIVVDYLQLVTLDGGGSIAHRVQEVSAITQGLKALAKELNVPVIALSQLSRQVEQREDKRPQLSDLRESGSIEQDADVVAFVYREAYYLGRAEPKEDTPEHQQWQDELAQVRGVADLIIGKQRHGPIGTVRLSFNEDTTRFGNLAKSEARYAARYPYGED
jgi:replicative DNA helicase